MTILHIAYLRNDPFTGVCVAAPEHIRHQGEIAEVALLNIRNCIIEGVRQQYIYKEKKWKDNVPPLFWHPDIVIFHEVYHKEFVTIAKSLQNEGIPYVIIPHGCLVKSAQHKKWLKKKIANFLYFNKFIYHASALQLLSANEKNNTHFKIKKFIGTNGIAVPVATKQGFSKGILTIIYIGRLEVIPKGLDLLFQAVRQVKQKNNNVSNNFTIDIYGPDVKGRYAEVESLIDQNDIKDIVTLHHELKGDEKQRRLLDADIFIQTSRHEGMPMGILEAMSYGIPCLITKGTSLGEIVEKYNSGWVADNTAESIAQTICEAISQRGVFKKKSSNARKLIEENFSWSNISEATIKKYQSLIRYNY